MMLQYLEAKVREPRANRDGVRLYLRNNIISGAYFSKQNDCIACGICNNWYADYIAYCVCFSCRNQDVHDVARLSAAQELVPTVQPRIPTVAVSELILNAKCALSILSYVNPLHRTAAGTRICDICIRPPVTAMHVFYSSNQLSVCASCRENAHAYTEHMRVSIPLITHGLKLLGSDIRKVIYTHLCLAIFGDVNY